jgi:hypothetical protein
MCTATRSTSLIRRGAGTKVGGAAISGVIDAGLSYRECRNLGQAALAGLMGAAIGLATAPLVSKMLGAVPLGAMLGIFTRRADDLPVGSAAANAVGAAAIIPDSALVRRIRGKLDLYPQVIDSRTGRSISFPSAIQGRTPALQQVEWGAKQRGEFISEWHRRGYAEPRGGWGNCDIHHIQPREFGGSNDFWNLVPVERETHKLLNSFWREFTGL